jgi:hypothetical protein
MRLLIILSVVLLSGCQSQAVRTANHHTKCGDYGFVKGTVEYGQCMMALENNDIAERQRKAALLQDWGETVQVPAPQLTPRPPVENYPSLNCTSTTVGDQVYTRCN